MIFKMPIVEVGMFENFQVLRNAQSSTVKTPVNLDIHTYVCMYVYMWYISSLLRYNWYTIIYKY